MISESILFKQLGILVIGGVKFLIAAPVSYLFGYSYLHTLLNTTAGGLLGVLFFFFLSRTIFRLYRVYSGYIKAGIGLLAGKLTLNADNRARKKQDRPAFSRKNRIIVRIRRTYGLPGLIILTPVLFSIPLGTFLLLKYYSRSRNLLAWLSLSVVVWSVVLTTVVELI